MVVILACISAFVFAQNADATIKPVGHSDCYSAPPNFVYRKVGDWDGKMDLNLPSKDKKP